MVVTELDVRYLAQANVGPVRTKCRLVGTAPDDPVEVRLVDTATGRISTLVYARAVPASPDRAAQVLHGAGRSDHLVPRYGESPAPGQGVPLLWPFDEDVALVGSSW